MKKMTDEMRQIYNQLFEDKKNQVRNTKDQTEVTGKRYYVSNDGNDINDGTTPETPWKTIDRVSNTVLSPGDGVFFRRGDLFRGSVIAQTGITYGAYGVGEKPRFYGWDEDLADPSLWIEADSANHIWKYKKKILDPGTLVFNHGETHCRKLIPSYKNGRFVCRENESKHFVMAQEMTQDLDMFWRFDGILMIEPSKGEDFPIPVTGRDVSLHAGDLFLRCDKGNPGKLFNSIEAVVHRISFVVGRSSNVTIDNLCMKYVCFGVTGGNALGLKVTNCELGWIGGNIQHYKGTDPNYPQGKRGTVTRYGNAIEIYGGCEGFTVSNCYIYQSYDAGITHQVNTSKKIVMKDVCYTNNLIECCVYGIEYFLDQIDGESESYMENIDINGNIIRLSGYGWGQQRHNVDTPAAIKGWSYKNTARNFSIHNNIFDRSAYRMLHLVSLKDEYCPKLINNTYIQHFGGMIGQYGCNEVAEPEILIFDENAERKIIEILGDKNAKVFYLED